MTGDGIFDKLSNLEIIDSVWASTHEDIKSSNIFDLSGKVADMIMKQSMNNGTLDNITCIFICFNNFKKNLQRKFSINSNSNNSKNKNNNNIKEKESNIANSTAAFNIKNEYNENNSNENFYSNNSNIDEIRRKLTYHKDFSIKLKANEYINFSSSSSNNNNNKNNLNQNENNQMENQNNYLDENINNNTLDSKIKQKSKSSFEIMKLKTKGKFSLMNINNINNINEENDNNNASPEHNKPIIPDTPLSNSSNEKIDLLNLKNNNNNYSYRKHKKFESANFTDFKNEYKNEYKNDFKTTQKINSKFNKKKNLRKLSPIRKENFSSGFNSTTNLNSINFHISNSSKSVNKFLPKINSNNNITNKNPGSTTYYNNSSERKNNFTFNNTNGQGFCHFKFNRQMPIFKLNK